MLIFSSCSEGVQRNQLVGRYTWNDGRIDTLEIRADSTYEYWTFSPGEKRANSGKWELTSNTVEFKKENFPFLPDHRRDGSWFSKVRLRDGEIRLMDDRDGRTYLVKVVSIDSSGNKTFAR